MQTLEPVDILRVSQDKAALGECPLWDPGTGHLWWLDCRRGHIHGLHWATQTHQHHEVPAPIGSMAFNRDGRWVLALKEEIVLFDPATRQMLSVGRLDDQHAHLRFNDGAALPDGRFLVGTMHTFRDEGVPPLGGLYVLETDGRLHRVDRGLGVVNGPVNHPVTGELFVADSEARQIYAYSHTDQEAWQKRVFVNTQSLESSPDGCCFDAQGGLWTALVRKGQLARFDAQGQLTHLVPVPLTHPSSLCFGGAELDDLFVTSISDSGRLSAQGALDGHVLCLKGLGFKGEPRPQCDIRPG
jgi:sugar lactone lactonase YvrE